jgi:nitrite reductase/ring-hydroxylating ferredoxin subunit
VRFILEDESEVAVFKVDGVVHVVSNICPHNHTNVMFEGYVDEDLYVACPIHGWQFSLKTGEVPPGCTGLSARLDVYNIKIDGDDLYIETKKRKFWKW